MLLNAFKLEEYFTKYEFNASFLLGSSDAQTLSMQALLDLADIDSKQLWNDLSLGYTETQGLPLLRQEITNLYKNIESDGILVCAGAEEGIYITLQTLIAPKAHVIIITPCYQSVKTLSLAVGAELSEVALTFTDQGWQLDLNHLKTAIRKDTQLIIVNFPHNPTSYIPDQHTYKEIIKLAKEIGAYVLSDEVYRYSEQELENRLPAACECYENAISLGVMSKSLGLAGLRIGWLATKNKNLLKKIAGYKNYLSICNSAPSEVLSIIALRAHDKIIQRNMQIINSNLIHLEEFFAKYRGLFSWYRPLAGVTAYPRLNHAIPIDQFAEQLVKEQGVMIIPGSVYDDTNNYFRIGFGRSNMPEALVRFEMFVRQLS